VHRVARQQSVKPVSPLEVEQSKADKREIEATFQRLHIDLGQNVLCK
jgi:hypothetical protein